MIPLNTLTWDRCPTAGSESRALQQQEVRVCKRWGNGPAHPLLPKDGSLLCPLLPRAVFLPEHRALRSGKRGSFLRAKGRWWEDEVVCSCSVWRHRSFLFSWQMEIEKWEENNHKSYIKTWWNDVCEAFFILAEKNKFRTSCLTEQREIQSWNN